MCAGARLVRPKEAVADTAGDALFLRPLHSLIVIGAGGHIAERACLNFLDKGNIDFNPAGGHGKVVLAVALVGQFQLLTILVGHGKVVQLITAVGLHRDGYGIALRGRLRRNGDGTVLGLIHRNSVAGSVRASAGGTGADGQLAILIADGVVAGGHRAAGRDLDLAGLGHVGGDLLAVCVNILHRRLGRQLLLAHQTGNGIAVRPQHGGLVTHIGGLILGLDGNSLLPHCQVAGRRCLVILRRGGRPGGDDRRARALDGDLAGAVHGGNRRLTALVGHGAALGLIGSGEGEVRVAVGLGHAAVLKLEAVLNQLICGMEGQRGGDVRIVLAADGDGPVLIRCSRDVHLAGVDEIAGSTRTCGAHHIAVDRIWNRIRDLRPVRHLPFREEIGCRQGAGLRSAAALDDVYGLGRRSVIVRPTDGDFLCGAGNVLIVIAAGLGRGDGHRTRLRGM